MRLERTVLHKVGPFEHFELDLSQVRGPLVAVCASNGSGKTFLLETSILGACYRRTETQGSPLARAWAADSYVESTFVNGTRQTFRHLLDGVKKKGEAIALGPDGVTPLWKDSVSVRAFDAWVEKHLPDEGVMKATTFATQKSEGFIGFGSAERIQVILEATGVARIERAAQLARKEVSRVESELAAVWVRIADAGDGAPDLTAAEAGATSAREALALAEAAAESAWQARYEAEQAEARRAELAREAAAANETRARIERDLDAARRRVQELGQRHAAADPQTATEALEACERELTAARAAWELAEESSRTADAAHAAALANSDARAKLERELAAAEAKVADLRGRIEHGKTYLAEADAIRAAVTRAEYLRNELATCSSAVTAAHARVTAAERASVQDAARVDAIERRIARAQEALAGREDVAAAELCIPNLERAAADARAELERISAELDELRAQHVAGAEERIVALRGGLTYVAHNREHVPSRRLGEVAAAAIVTDDQAVRLASELPTKTAAALAAKGEANARATAAEAELAAARTVAARASAMLAAEEDHAAAGRELAELCNDLAEHEREANEARGVAIQAEAATLSARDALEATNFLAQKLENLTKAESVAELRASQLTEALGSLGHLRDQLSALPPAGDVPPPGAGAARERGALDAAEASARNAATALGAAEATRRELEPQVSGVRATLERLVSELAAAPVAAVVPPPVDVARTRAEAEHCERVSRNLGAELARDEQRLEHAKAAAARAAELGEQRAALEAELSDWTRLALDLGRDGIQSALVDAAGPELTELCNDLLRCHGTRYTVTIETKRAKADGKGETDECRVMVIDTVAGTEKEAREHSGGERTLIGEAISLALTMLACKRSGTTDVTLVRDESGAALDPENARAYVAMLRRAASIVGARHVLIVSHDALVQELCDHRIELPRKVKS